jgi:hypothetical protein
MGWGVWMGREAERMLTASRGEPLGNIQLKDRGDGRLDHWEIGCEYGMWMELA